LSVTRKVVGHPRHTGPSFPRMRESMPKKNAVIAFVCPGSPPARRRRCGLIRGGFPPAGWLQLPDLGSCRTRKYHAPQNLSFIRRIALDILNAQPDTRSAARKMKLYGGSPPARRRRCSACQVASTAGFRLSSQPRLTRPSS
jgi:hypothetical protein